MNVEFLSTFSQYCTSDMLELRLHLHACGQLPKSCRRGLTADSVLQTAVDAEADLESRLLVKKHQNAPSYIQNFKKKLRILPPDNLEGEEREEDGPVRIMHP